MFLTKAKQKKHKRAASNLPKRESDRVWGLLLIGFDCRGPCNDDHVAMQRTQIGGFQPTSTSWGKLKRCKNEHGTEKTYAIAKRINDKCDEKADEWTDNVLERLPYLTVRATDLHAADAYYRKDGSSEDDLSQVIPRKKH